VGLTSALPRGLRPRTGPLEPPWARRRRLRAESGTWALGAAALGLTVAALAAEVGRVWSRHPPETLQQLDLLGSADAVVRETAAVARAGYEEASTRENALLNVLGSFSLTFGVARLSTFVIRRRRGRRLGPLGDLFVGGHHVHHFVPGIVLAFLAGGASILSRDENLDPLLALPFGIGVALTLDESALLLRLDDVYWTEEGIVSVQITLAALSLTSATALALRALRRGEQRILEEHDPAPA
jgi:hypothetical protein